MSHPFSVITTKKVFCAECKFFYPHAGKTNHRTDCKHQLAKVGEPDLIYGIQHYRSCGNMRSEGGACGPGGILHVHEQRDRLDF